MLEYPFDSAYIMRKKKSLAETLRKADCSGSIRLAILGGSTTNHIADVLELFLLDAGIRPTIYQCEYGQFYEEVLYHNEQLLAFQPDFIYLHTTNKNVLRYPEMTDSAEAVEDKLLAEFGRYKAVWERAAADYGCTIIQNNFEPPEYRLLGNRDAYDHRGRVHFLSRLNQLFGDYAEQHKSLFINDIDYLSARCGLDSWNDPTPWHMYKYSPAPSCIPTLCHSVACIIKSALGRNKKALVLDLDNTLWGGVVGDDGVEGIEIGHETPSGQVFHAFQSYLRELKSTGVMLNVNSKNDYENAMAGLRHPSSALTPEDFIVIKANWENKDRNIAQIANELNIMTDSLVFIDDNPVERGIVSAMKAGIAVPELTEPESYIRTIDRSGFFEVTNFSDDDLRRNEMYKKNAERAQLAATAGSYEDYLRSLAMTAVIHPFEEVYLPRIAQLTGKSNQFNLTTRRYTTAEIEGVAKDEEKIALYGSLADCFGDNGVVSVIIGEKQGDTLDLVLWIMSCRVLKRGMEDAMLDSLVAAAKAAGITKLQGHYYPTAKNGMVQDFYTGMGFTLLERSADGQGLWELPLFGYENRNTIIKVE